MRELSHGDAHRYLGITYAALSHAVMRGWIKPRYRGGKPFYNVDKLDELKKQRKYGEKRR